MCIYIYTYIHTHIYMYICACVCVSYQEEYYVNLVRCTIYSASWTVTSTPLESIFHIRQWLLIDRPVLGRRSSGSGHQRWVARFPKWEFCVHADFHVTCITHSQSHSHFPFTSSDLRRLFQLVSSKEWLKDMHWSNDMDWYPESFAVFVNLHTLVPSPPSSAEVFTILTALGQG